MRFTGFSTLKNSFDFTIVKKSIFAKEFIKTQKDFILNSGILNKIWNEPKKGIEYLTELNLSKKVYLLENNNYKFIIINNKDMQVFEDENYLYSLQIEYSNAYSEANFSFFNETNIIPGDFNLDFNNDYF